MSNSYYSIASALLEAEKVLGVGNWKPINGEQEKVLNFLKKNRRYLPLNWVESIASIDHNIINQFLIKKGFRIKLEPFGPDAFGVASSMDVKVGWENQGIPTTIESKDKSFKGIKFNSGIEFYRSRYYSNPIIRINTKDKNVFVWLTRVFHRTEHLSPAMSDLGYSVVKLMNSCEPDNSFDSLSLPVVDFHEKLDLNWLVDLLFLGNDRKMWIITQSKQENILKLDEIGVTAKSGTAMSLVRVTGCTPYIVNFPFVIWIQDTSLPYPILTAQIDQNHWVSKEIK